ncbi:hypothetical protein C7S13_1304 [Burkholderia cepacia]|nr:hypothetical protein [Burkholderia cepacia]QOH33453.1 hypothetical protein C7S14_6420 [Burkholderia cepacia]
MRNCADNATHEDQSCKSTRAPPGRPQKVQLFFLTGRT